ncbi:MAG: ABC transporter ATP-binding protein, partial [Anaerolineae bacterium]|nr:ABC transporter ATP-binding protein [Anaerolineae bacterium]
MSEPMQFEEEEFTTKFNGRTVARMLSLAKPYWRWVLGFILMIVLTSIIDSFFTYQGKRIIDEGIMAGNRARLTQLVTAYGIMTIVQAGSVFGFIYLAGVLGERINYDIRRKLFNHLQDLSFSYFDKTPVGWIMSRVTSDAGRIAELVTWGLLDISFAVASVSTSMVFMAFINWKMSLIALVVVPVMIGMAFWFRTKMLWQYREVRKQNSKLTGMYNESITGVRVVKALNREDKNLDEFVIESGEMYRASYRAAWWSALFLPLVQLVSAFG